MKDFGIRSQVSNSTPGELQNNMSTRISDIRSKKQIESNLDYLFYTEEPSSVKPFKKIEKEKKIKKKPLNIKLYFIMFISFCFLNSYFIINILNSKRISYKTSLIIRGLLFMIIYYMLTLFIN